MHLFICCFSLFPFSWLLKLVSSVSSWAWWATGPSPTVKPHTPSMFSRLFPPGTPSETSVVGLHHVATWASMEFPESFHWGLCFLPQCHQCPALKKDLSAKFWKLDDQDEVEERDTTWRLNVHPWCFSFQRRLCCRERDCMVGCGSRSRSTTHCDVICKSHNVQRSADGF